MDVVSLFSGIGGLDRGFIDAGFNVVWANDFDKYAEEEMFICTSTTNGTKVDAYRFKTDKEFEKVSSIINLGTYKPEQFFVLQKYYYVNDITL